MLFICHENDGLASNSGGTNMFSGKYIYTEDLLALGALSSDGAGGMEDSSHSRIELTST